MVVGFTCGAFDLLHPGHLHMLQVASEQCDKLIVGLHTDPTNGRPEKQKSVQTTFERYIQLAYADFNLSIVPYDTERDLENLFSVFDINKRFLGDDYEGKDFTAKKICEDLGIEIIYVPRKHTWSSSELKFRVRQTQPAYYDVDDLLRGPQ